MPFNWSTEKESLFRFESDVLVSASAGTGKTTALVELFLRILEGRTALGDDVGVENILAITFTKKAAREMRERVSRGLLERRGAGGGQGLDDVLQDAYIHTFHAFCTRTLRSYAFEAGLAPDFGVAEDLEAARLLDCAVLEGLRGRLERDDEDLLRLLRGRRFSELQKHVGHLIRSRHGTAIALLDETAEHDRILTILRNIERYYAELLAQLRSLVTSPDASEAMHRNVERLVTWHHENPKGCPDDTVTPEEGTSIFREWWEQVKALRAGPKQVEFRELVVELKEQLKRLEAAYFDLHTIPDRAALMRLAEEAGERYRLTKREANRLDFDDLQHLTIGLLRDRPDVRKELSGQFRVILVDEFQDTNRTQKKLLDTLRLNPEEAAAMGRPPTRFLFVGDRKQSIYRFRGADVSVFRELEKQWVGEKTQGRRLHFADNFRSSPELLEFFNAFFTSAMAVGGGHSFSVDYEPDDNLLPGWQTTDEGETGAGKRALPVDLIVGCSDGSETEKRQIEAANVAERLLEIVHPEQGLRIPDSEGGRILRFDDIALLLRRMTHAGIYEEAFRQAGIPYVLTQSSGLYERLEVRDLINLVRFLIRPLNPLARLAFLRSPAVLMPDPVLPELLSIPDRRWLPETFTEYGWKPIMAGLKLDDSVHARLKHAITAIDSLRRRMSILPVSELLEELIERLDLDTVDGLDPAGLRMQANRHKLVEQTRIWERAEQGFGPEAFLRRIDDIRRLGIREPEAPAVGGRAVTIMTIHQAKGLEFPVVVLPDLSHRSHHRLGSVFVTDQNTLGMKFVLPSEQTAHDTLSYLENKEIDTAQELAERQRLLYVAMTRAKHHLILAGELNLDKLDKDPSGWSWFDTIVAFWQRNGWEIPEPSVGEAADEDERAVEVKESVLDGFDDVSLDDLLEEWQRSQPMEHKPDLVGTYGVTQLTELLQCERRFQLRRLLDRSTLLWMEAGEDDDEEEGDVPESGRGLGTLVHAFFEHHDLDIPVDQAAWRGFVVARGLDPEDPRLKAAGEQIERAGAFPQAKQPDDRVWRELPFLSELRLPSGRTVRLKGRLDALKLTTKGRLDLVDYKMARFNERKHERHAFQLKIYAAVLRQSFDTPDTLRHAGLAYLPETTAWKDVAVDAASLDAFLAELDVLVNRAVELEKAPLAKVAGQTAEACRYEGCRYAGTCFPELRNSLDRDGEIR